MHFFYGLGAFVSPMIAEPFLLNEDCTIFIDNVTTPTPAPGIVGNVSLPADSLQEAQHMTRVRYAFWILGLLQVSLGSLQWCYVSVMASYTTHSSISWWRPSPG